MVIEVIGSLFAGIVASSFALIAFGRDSLIELLSASAVLVHLRKDSAGSTVLGRDRETHQLPAPFPVIAIPSTYSYFFGGFKVEASPIGLIIAGGAVLIMPFLWFGKRRIGEETRCLPLSIDTLESATCFFMSIALLGGLLAGYLFGLGWADYLATLVILGFVGREAVESFREVHP